MKNLLLTLFAVLLLVACIKESSEELSILNEDQITLRKGDKFDVCHKGKILSANAASLRVHKDHGDAVDLDGDGYFDIDNVCGPTDCDDTNPDLTDNCCVDVCPFCAPEYQGLLKLDNGCSYYCHFVGDYGDYYSCGYPLLDEYAFVESHNYCEDSPACFFYGYWYTRWSSNCGVTTAFTEISYEDCTGVYMYDYVVMTKEEAQICIALINDAASASDLIDDCEDYTALNGSNTQLSKPDLTDKFAPIKVLPTSKEEFRLMMLNRYSRNK